MRPAQLVDIDCDIYEPTVEAMEFMLEQRLLRRGSYVFYDDWDEVARTGERKAHHELSEKYAMVWRSFEVPYLFQLVAIHDHGSATAASMPSALGRGGWGHGPKYSL